MTVYNSALQCLKLAQCRSKEEKDVWQVTVVFDLKLRGLKLQCSLVHSVGLLIHRFDLFQVLDVCCFDLKVLLHQPVSLQGHIRQDMIHP